MEEEYNEEKLKKVRSWIIRWGIGFIILIVIIWFFMVLFVKVFLEGYFMFWVVIVIIWGIVGFVVIIIMFIVESWEIIYFIILGMICRFLVKVFKYISDEKIIVG